MKDDLQGHQISADVNGIDCVYNDKWKDLCYGSGIFYEVGPLEEATLEGYNLICPSHQGIFMTKCQRIT